MMLLNCLIRSRVAYDFINYGKFEVTIDEVMLLTVLIKQTSKPWAASLFREQLEKSGFDTMLTRLYEASLFISMSPFHIDRPLKVLAFAATAVSIIDELSR